MSIARRLKPAHLRLVLRIAETGKLQSAAEDVALSQPAASRMLSEIEMLVGAPLFDRHPKGMEPTAVGLAVLRHARQILTGFDTLEADVERAIFGRGGKVRIGTVTGPAVGMVVPSIRAVRDTMPEVEFTVEVGPSTTLMRRLDEGDFDFVISRLPPEHNSRNYRVYPARNEVVSLMVCRNHPMAALETVHLQDLTGFDWVMQERGTPIRAAVEEMFHALGIELPPFVTNSSSLLVALALLEGSTTISPQSNEVVELLAGSALATNVTRLNLFEDILVSPFFVIVPTERQLSAAADRVIRETLNRL